MGHQVVLVCQFRPGRSSGQSEAGIFRVRAYLKESAGLAALRSCLVVVVISLCDLYRCR